MIGLASTLLASMILFVIKAICRTKKSQHRTSNIRVKNLTFCITETTGHSRSNPDLLLNKRSLQLEACAETGAQKIVER